MWRWLRWVLFAAGIALVLGLCVAAELHEAKIYYHGQPAKAESRNGPVSKPVGSTATKPESEATEHKGNWYDHITDWLLALFSFLLVIYTRRLYEATSGLFSETAGLRTAADKQSADMQASIKAAIDSANAAIASNQIAVTTSERELQAYVTACSVDGIPHRQAGRMSAYGTEIPGRAHTYDFAVVLKNGGQTPAINVRTNISLQRFEGEVPADFDFPSSDSYGYGVIGPQIEWRTNYQTLNASLIEDLAPIILIWGWVEYDDIFTASGSTTRHRTEFCYRIDRRRLPYTNELWMGFIAYHLFNAVEGDCLRPIDPATGEGGG